jgi:hypothetical protein
MSFKKLANITIVLILTACSTIKVVPVEGDSFVKYVERFEVLYGQKVTGVDISLGLITDLDGKIKTQTGAVCFMTKPRKIVLNVVNWDDKSELFQEMLVFHELGHCVLNRHHTDLDEDYEGSGYLKLLNCPESIMHSGTTSNRMTDWCYKRFRDYYVMELFLEPRVREILFGSGK